MKNEVRLIDMNVAMFNAHKEIYWTESQATAVCNFLVHQPTVDPETLRPKGRWLGEGDGYADGEIVYDVWYCSECNYCIDDGTDDPEMLPNYCPNCGAKMGM